MKIRFRFTREGRAFVGVTFGVGLAAVNTGNNLLYLVLGLMLSTMLLSGVLSESVLRGIGLTRRLPARAFAGSSCLVEIVLRNDKRRLPSFSVEVRDVFADGPSPRRCFFLKVPADSSESAAYRLEPPRRGYHDIEGLRVSTRFPFGIIEKIRILPVADRLLVYPGLLPTARKVEALSSTSAEEPMRRLGRGDELAGLREHRPLDEARMIHWRRTAALGRLVSREYHHAGARRLSLVIDNRRPASPEPDWDVAFELSVSMAASLAADALARGLTVRVHARGAQSPVVAGPAPPDPIFRFLALLPVEPSESRVRLVEPPESFHVVHVPIALDPERTMPGRR